MILSTLPQPTLQCPILARSPAAGQGDASLPLCPATALPGAPAPGQDLGTTLNVAGDSLAIEQSPNCQLNTSLADAGIRYFSVCAAVYASGT